MKNAAVICEYNPFHNGHRYQLDFMRNELGADNIIAIMSGSFVQRGEPALLDKYTRARLALLNGADVVLEIPPVFSTASAAEYASAGVGIAYKSGIIDMLCFGTEGNVSLSDLAGYSELMNEASNNNMVKELLKNGATYPEALSYCLEKNLINSDFAFSDKLTLPNNILAASYLYALKHKELFSCEGARDIMPYAIERVGSGYADEILSESFASASAIRKYLKDLNVKANSEASIHSVLNKYVPDSVIDAIYEAFTEGGLVFPDDMSSLLSLRLLDAGVFVNNNNNNNFHNCCTKDTHSPVNDFSSYPRNQLSDYLDVSREIADRILNNADRIMSFSERALHTKTRQYTYSRISRALLHIILGITREEFDKRKKDGYISYIRVLGFRKDAAASGLLKALKANASVPVVTKPADYKELLSHDLYCDQIYWSLKNKTGEYEHSPIIV